MSRFERTPARDVPRGGASPVRRHGTPHAVTADITPVAAAPSGAHDAPAAVGPLLAGRHGDAFDSAACHDMEARFGLDFGAVRIHADADAAVSAKAMDARAYTVGQHMVFAAGEYAPQTGRGRELIAHELAHTVQQRGTVQTRSHGTAQSLLESSAEAAGRDAANGAVVMQALPASDIGVSRNVASALSFDDQELVDKLQKYTERLKQPSYPERESDLSWVTMLKAEIERRILTKRSALPPRPAAPREPPPPTREQVAAEAEAWVAKSRADNEAEEAAEKAPPPSPVAPVKSKFSPGGFSNDDIDAVGKADRDRLEAELAPPSDPRLFRVRIAEAKKKAPMTVLSDDFPRSVWDYGLSHGLFSAREEIAVLQTLRAPKLAERAAAAKRQKMEAERQRQLKHEKVISDMNVNMIGAFATAPGKGFLAVTAKVLATPQRAQAVATGIVAGHSAIAKGDPSALGDFAISTLPHFFFRSLGLPPRTPRFRVPGGGNQPGPAVTARSSIAEPVTPAQVRQAYRAEPFSVQKSGSHEWHQQQWEANGGTGKAPIAFRTGTMIRVNELRWLAVGQLSEINTPADLAPSRVVRPAGNVRTADALAQTGAAVDPLANTAPPRQTQYSAPPVAPPAPPPARFKAPPAQPGRQQGYPRVEPEVVVEAHRINPDAIVPSWSSGFHASVWRYAGGGADVPVAFKVGNRIRVDVARLPADVRAAIGYAMRL